MRPGEELTSFAFNEDNNGFLSLYEAVKDALLVGVGVMKIWFDERQKEPSKITTGWTRTSSRLFSATRSSR